MMSMTSKGSAEQTGNFQLFNFWEHICANCGKIGDNENILKIFGRCKAHILFQGMSSPALEGWA